MIFVSLFCCFLFQPIDTIWQFRQEGRSFSLFVLRSGKYFSGVSLLIIVAAGSYVLIRNVPEVGDRFRSIGRVVNETKIDKTSSESNSIRILIWQKDIELIKEYFFTGVGTGDVKDELFKKYRADGITGAYKVDPTTDKPISILNAHSQFLQTFIAIGILGFILFISGFVYPIINSIRRRNYLYLGFLVLVILNFTTESMLETQAGVLFYAFFNALLYKADEFGTISS
ncbi:MAG: O-antigen ligase family protein [Bacteroidetes bacterium]|nr:O-antigen ligase family protein [Bacteroidota bacterium]